MRVGQIELPANKIFFVGDLSKASEHIPALGMTGFVPSEFLPDLPSVSFGGRLLKTFNNARTLYEREEDLCAINTRRASYNYVHNVRGRSGFISVSQVKPKPDRSQLWPYEGNGMWYDVSRYTLMYHSQPIQMVTTSNIRVGNNFIALPLGATYSGGDGSGYATTLSTEDGTVNVLRSNTTPIRFDLTAKDYINGECKCFDGTSQVYSENHLFTGEMVVNSGNYRVRLKTNQIVIDYYQSGTWNNIDTFTVGTFSRWWTTFNTPDHIIAKTNSGIVVDIERGKVPHLFTLDNIVPTTISPTPASTGTENGYCMNYLPLGASKFVAGNGAFSITGSSLGSGHRWIYYDGTGEEYLQAQNCMIMSNLSRQVVER